MSKDCVVLINHPLGGRARYGRLAVAGSYVAPQGLCSIAAVLRRAGFRPVLLDAAAAELAEEACARQVLGQDPLWVGITAATPAAPTAGRLAGLIKGLEPATPVLLGGPHATSVPTETLERFSTLDACVLGEGEATALEVTQTLAAGQDLTRVPGLLLRTEAGLTFTGERSPLPELDDLPLPAWDLLPGFPRRYAVQVQSSRRTPAVSVITSRGCTGRCTFCDRSVFGNRCRAHSADYVLWMLGELVGRWLVRHVQFEDDNFLLYRRRLLSLCCGLLRARLGLTWSCQARVDAVLALDEGELALMRRAGCTQVMLGVESGDPAVLERLGKGFTLDQAWRAVGRLRRAGLSVKGFFMLGCPGESEASLRRTQDFALSAGFDDISLCMFTPFPGAALYREIGRAGQFDPSWERANLYEPVFWPYGLDASDLERWEKSIYTRFYLLRPAAWGRYLARAGSAAGFWRALCGALALLRHVLEPAGARPAIPGGAAPPAEAGPNGQVEVSVVIPAHNEEPRLGATLEALGECLTRLGKSHEFVVVNDGSRDGTEAAARRARVGAPVTVLGHSRPRGKGYAVRRGLLAARGERIICVDADLPCGLEAVGQALSLLEDGADVVAGSRVMPGARIEQGAPPLRRRLGHVFARLAHLLFTLPVYDTQCGFKAYRREAARDVLRRCRVDGFTFDVELLFIAHRLGYRVRGLPIRLCHRDGSSVRVVLEAMRTMRDLLGIRLNHARGYYQLKGKRRPAQERPVFERPALEAVARPGGERSEVGLRP